MMAGRGQAWPDSGGRCSRIPAAGRPLSRWPRWRDRPHCVGGL